MPVLTVEHVTTYNYRRVVGFGEHRMMFRPRDSADQRLLSWTLSITPEPVELRSMPDPFGNIVTIARFSGRARTLHFENRLAIEHTPVVPEAGMLMPFARVWPFTYSQDDCADLARVRERHYDDPDRVVDAWARLLLVRSHDTLALLSNMTEEIRRGFTYAARYEEGVQEPARTLALRCGTCRDYAVLMMEAVRALGLAARFVSGYIYSPGGTGEARVGGGSTHAWVEVYLPGLGWTEFDPTNGIVGTRDLIRVASVRDWHQAVPLSGTWTGFPADSLGMTVSVSVGRHADADSAAAALSARAAAWPGVEAGIETGAASAVVSLQPAREAAATRAELDRSAVKAV